MTNVSFGCTLIKLIITGFVIGITKGNSLPENEQISNTMIMPETRTGRSVAAVPPMAMKNPCTLYLIEYERIFNQSTGDVDREESSWVCELDAEDRIAFNSYFTVKVEGLGDKILSVCKDEYRARSNSCVVSGQTLLYSPYAEIKQKSIKFHPKNPPIVTKKPHRHGKRNLAAAVGNRTVVVLRVIASDTSTNYTAAELHDRIFNTSHLSLRSGYEACSYGQLILKPTTHSLAVKGVVTVTINMVATGADVNDIVNAIFNKATTSLGDLPSQFDHVMIAMPPGVKRYGQSFTNAYAYVGGYLSVYSGRTIGYSSVIMHEIGHNLNLGHSGEDTDEYGDQSCLMGYSYYGASYASYPYFPKMCFNGAKSFKFGWYSSRTKMFKAFTIGTSTYTTQYTLIGSADYQNANNDGSSLVVVKVETGSPDYYIYFNRKIGFNSEVQEYADSVVVVSQGDDPSESWVVTKFNSAGSYTVRNAGGSRFDITINVSSINLSSNPAKATVSVTRTLSSQTVVFDDETLRGAVNQWIMNRTIALVAFGNITQWNTADVTNLDYLFYGRSTFNADISNWNTAKVTSMDKTFYGARAFSRNISNWNVGRVTSMSGTFYYASVFNVPLNNWNLSSVMDLSEAFAYATKFNGDVSQWNVGKVTSLYSTFYGTRAFNKNISSWNTGRVMDMSWAFGDATAFNSAIGYWNISKVSDLSYMFYGATKFNQSLCWNISGKISTSWFSYSSGSLAPVSCRK